ncbi:MAG: hypothetical protein NTZ27_10485 [Ignavibacteriales bacterium]|nr:hypothetical protein [Ignavibacteriales bacterium]
MTLVFQTGIAAMGGALVATSLAVLNKGDQMKLLKIFMVLMLVFFTKLLA